MPSTFSQPVNDFATTLASAHTANSGTLALAASPGTLGANRVWRVTALSNPDTTNESVLAILQATGNTAGNLMGVTAVEDSTDVDLASGTAIQIRMTALDLAEVQAAVNTAETNIATINGEIAALPPLASDAITTATALRLVCWGDSLTAGAGGTPYPTQLEPLVNRDCLNEGVGGNTSSQIETRFLASTGTTNFATVIWAGRNDILSPYDNSIVTAVMADIASMVATLGHTRYLVLTVLNEASEILGTDAHTLVLAINAAIMSTYPNNYLDIRSYLVSQYNPGLSQDVTDHTNDITPTSLRSDTVHLNTAGYLLVAQQVAAKMAVLEPAVKAVATTNLGALMAAPAGPIGSVAPTTGAFTNLAAAGTLNVTGETFLTTMFAGNIWTSGSNASVNITRRDNGVEAWVFYSGAGELGFYNYVLGGNAITVSAADNSVVFAGVLNGNGSGLTGIPESGVTNLEADLAGKQAHSSVLDSLASDTYSSGALLIGQGTGVPATAKGLQVTSSGVINGSNPGFQQLLDLGMASSVFTNLSGFYLLLNSPGGIWLNSAVSVGAFPYHDNTITASAYNLGPTNSQAVDSGVSRESAGVVQITNGSTGLGSLLLGTQSTTQTPLTVQGIASQTAPLVNLQQLSSTSTARDCGYIDATMPTATDASFVGKLRGCAQDWNETPGGVEGWAVTTDGAANPKLGFYGATPVAKAAAPSTLSDVITILRNLGLCS